MTPLRQRMIDAMVLRGFSARTQESYTDAIYGMAKYYRRDPAEYSAQEVQAYLLYLINERHLSYSTMNQAACAARFLYEKVLGRERELFPIAMADSPLRGVGIRLQGAQAGRCTPGTTDAMCQPPSHRVGPGVHGAGGRNRCGCVSMLQAGAIAGGGDFGWAAAFANARGRTCDNNQTAQSGAAVMARVSLACLQFVWPLELRHGRLCAVRVGSGSVHSVDRPTVRRRSAIDVSRPTQDMSGSAFKAIICACPPQPSLQSPIPPPPFL